MLQMSLDMPFGHLVASLDTEANAMKAAEDDPNRQLPELVYTMFVPLSHQIQQVYEASKVELRVKVKGKKPSKFSLPSAGFQTVEPIEGKEDQLYVSIDLQRPARASSEDRNEPEYVSPSAMVRRMLCARHHPHSPSTLSIYTHRRMTYR